MVSGWRRDRKDKVATRKLPSWIANWVIGRVSGVKLHDYGCTLKAYKREFLEDVHLYGEMHRFIPIYAKWAGARVTEMVVTHHPRREGKSKYGLMRTFKVLLDLVTVKFLGDYSTKPLYFFGGLGFALCGAGALTAMFTLFQRFAEHAYVHRNPLFVISVFLFMLGCSVRDDGAARRVANSDVSRIAVQTDLSHGRDRELRTTAPAAQTGRGRHGRRLGVTRRKR